MIVFVALLCISFSDAYISGYGRYEYPGYRHGSVPVARRGYYSDYSYPQPHQYSQVYTARDNHVHHLSSPNPIQNTGTSYVSSDYTPVITEVPSFANNEEPTYFDSAAPLQVGSPPLTAVPAVPRLHHSVQEVPHVIENQLPTVHITENHLQAIHVPHSSLPAVHVTENHLPGAVHVDGDHEVLAPVEVVQAGESFQFHAQDELGNAEYGYRNQNSAKHEVASANGHVRGSYSYLDEAGHHTVNYIADDWGFRLV